MKERGDNRVRLVIIFSIVLVIVFILLSLFGFLDNKVRLSPSGECPEEIPECNMCDETTDYSVVADSSQDGSACTTTDGKSGKCDNGGCKVCDEDGDGYDSENCGGDDCDDGDDQVNPGASESGACFDGIDNDCSSQADCADSACDGATKTESSGSGVWARWITTTCCGGQAMTAFNTNSNCGFCGNACPTGRTCKWNPGGLYGCALGTTNPPTNGYTQDPLVTPPKPSENPIVNTIDAISNGVNTLRTLNDNIPCGGAITIINVNPPDAGIPPVRVIGGTWSW